MCFCLSVKIQREMVSAECYKYCCSRYDFSVSLSLVLSNDFNFNDISVIVTLDSIVNVVGVRPFPSITLRSLTLRKNNPGSGVSRSTSAV